jgi:hypothetical protein
MHGILPKVVEISQITTEYKQPLRNYTSFCDLICLGMHSNMMLRFMVQAFQDPPLCSSTRPARSWFNLSFFLRFLIFLSPPFAWTIKIWPPQKVCLIWSSQTKTDLPFVGLAIFYKFDFLLQLNLHIWTLLSSFLFSLLKNKLVYRCLFRFCLQYKKMCVDR